ncbi:hypothetical protein [Nitrospirillum amazonense]|uniref:hypothetical protein n=1 Tax=Nitrospirillum amazonense TaxID=28077 RepID=UPI0024127E73|nr:hypothetical protein [Nitrospirillum amazonense]MDG3444502.1 hypothetical protein [Nitrospirillum amazonense]
MGGFNHMEAARRHAKAKRSFVKKVRAAMAREMAAFGVPVIMDIQPPTNLLERHKAALDAKAEAIRQTRLSLEAAALTEDERVTLHQVLRRMRDQGPSPQEDGGTPQEPSCPFCFR